jgi:polyisoprenyl-teichoic acid--peptidoglycan teichoic acid transferase
MDDYRRFRRTNKTGPSSVDGFVRRSQNSDAAGFQFKRHSSYQPSGSKQDGFSRTERYFSGDNNRQALRSRPQTHKSADLLDRPVPTSHVNTHKNRSGHRWSKVATKTFAAVFIVTVLMGGYLFGKGYLKARQIFKGGGSAVALQENVDPTKLNGEGDGRVNILLLGTGGEEHDNGSFLTDTIIVASIDPTQKEAALLSIPRDFYVRTDYGSMRINAVYKIARNAYRDENSNDKAGAEKAGLQAIEGVVEKTMGIPIHYHAMIDFEGFKKAIDTVGGITINVQDPVYEAMRIDGRNYVLDVKSGRERFDGFRALAFARSRKTSPRGDFDRSERQRLMLIALKDKVLSLGTLSNPVKLNQLFSDFGDHMRTNLSINEVLRLHEIGSSISADKVQSVSLIDEPNVLLKSANYGGSVQIPAAGLNNYKEIHSFVRNKLKDGFLRNEDATVAVLNGTNVSGLAARTAQELKSYGYNVSQIADSPIKNQQKTTIVDMRDGKKKYTKAYLEKRFGVSTVRDVPDNRIVPGDADFVIILGQNEQNRLEN